MICRVLPIEFGPIRLAFGENFWTDFGSAFARQPAITSGFDFSFLMRFTILLAVASLTEHVTIRLRSESLALDARVWPPFTISPEIISASAKLAEQP